MTKDADSTIVRCLRRTFRRRYGHAPRICDHYHDYFVGGHYVRLVVGLTRYYVTLRSRRVGR